MYIPRNHHHNQDNEHIHHLQKSPCVPFFKFNFYFILEYNLLTIVLASGV